MSLNFTVAGDRVSSTPCMLGSVPASYGSLSPLAHEEADGYQFVNALTDDQRARAVIWHRPPPDFATRLVPRIGEVELPDHVFEPEPDYRITDAERSALAYVRSGPRGIGGAELTAGQLRALTDLVAEFAGRLPREVAEAELRRMDAAGTENLWFAWAGGTADFVPSHGATFPATEPRSQPWSHVPSHGATAFLAVIGIGKDRRYLTPKYGA